MAEQMSDSLSTEEIMERIRERVRLRKGSGNGTVITEPVAGSVPTARPRAAILPLYDLSEMRQNAAASNMLRDQVGRLNPRRPGLHNDLIQLAKKTLQRMFAWYTRSLQEFNASLMRTLTEGVRALENLQQNVIALADSQKSLADSQNSLAQRVGSLADSQNSFARRLDVAEASQAKLTHELGERLARIEQAQSHGLEERLRLNERNFRRVAYMLEQKSQRRGAAINTDTPPMFSSDIPSESEFDYFLFEERFRGSEEDIKNRQRSYLEIFRGRQNVLDLGCGRGEFLELLQDNGVSARGVESNTDMFLLCRDKGLDVVQQNLFDYLDSVPDASIGGIFCSQVIEHLPAGLQIRLVALCHKKLKPSSPLVIETINPECLFALSRNFFLDPTHVRPVHPEMMRFILETMHFEKVELQFSSPANLGQPIPKLTLPQPWSDLDRFNQVWERMNTLLFGYQDYAVVSYR